MYRKILNVFSDLKKKRITIIDNFKLAETLKLKFIYIIYINKKYKTTKY